MYVIEQSQSKGQSTARGFALEGLRHAVTTVFMTDKATSRWNCLTVICPLLLSWVTGQQRSHSTIDGSYYHRMLDTVCLQCNNPLN